MNKYFRVLDLPYDAPLSEVRKAYRDLVLVWHPDRFAGNERLQKAATEKLMQINEAYRFLRMHATADVEVEAEDKPPVADDTIDWGAFARPTKSDGRSTFKVERVQLRPLRSSPHKWLTAILLVALGVGALLLAAYFYPDKSSSHESSFPPPTEEALNTRTVVDSMQYLTPPPSTDTTSTTESVTNL